MSYHSVKDDELWTQCPAGVIDPKDPDVEEGAVTGEHDAADLEMN